MTKQKLQEELKNSMMARDELRTSVLRLLLSSLSYYEIQKGGAGYTASEEDVLSVIQKEAKQRRDSIEEFKKAGRQELVDKETSELEILQSFLPEQMSEDEVKAIVEQAIIETGTTTIADMGKVMGALTGKLKSKADMGFVSNLVRERLS
ncbi:MAG: GatB/YqeY domain-containing protein [Candidatus Levybacteria bacterium]|nr:GatB/YqeY domain-containing protein [Candidatus Levybacteria bacterium]MBI2420495.1 GatB/YqeY domain-containing protein [Candidatus Levybacteria bacterium]